VELNITLFRESVKFLQLKDRTNVDLKDKYRNINYAVLRGIVSADETSPPTIEIKIEGYDNAEAAQTVAVEENAVEEGIAEVVVPRLARARVTRQGEIPWTVEETEA
jgi:hypothetical protein